MGISVAFEALLLPLSSTQAIELNARVLEENLREGVSEQENQGNHQTVNR
jgi:hypothetical protein